MFLSGIVGGINQIMSNPSLNKSITFGASTRVARALISVLVAGVILLVLFIICYAIYYAIRVKYLRPYFINSPKDFDAILDEVYAYLNEAHGTLVKSPVLAKMPFTLEKTLAFIQENVVVKTDDKGADVQRKYLEYPRCAELDKDGVGMKGVERRDETAFEVYLYHDGALDLSGLAAMFESLQHSLMVYRQYSPCGDDDEKGTQVVRRAIDAVHKVQAEVVAARDHFVSSLDAVPYGAADAADMTRLAMCVHRLHYYLVLKSPELKLMAESRRFSITNFFVLTMSTFTNAIWIEQVVMRWNSIWGGYSGSEALNKYGKHYYKVGDQIDSIPEYTRQLMRDMVEGK